MLEKLVTFQIPALLRARVTGRGVSAPPEATKYFACPASGKSTPWARAEYALSSVTSGAAGSQSR